MVVHPVGIEAALASIENAIGRANRHLYAPDDDVGAGWLAEYALNSAITQTLMLLENLSLTESRKRLAAALGDPQAASITRKNEIYGDQYYLWVEELNGYLDGIRNIYLPSVQPHVVVGLHQFLRSMTRFVCDRGIFPDAPGDEDDVHKRIEAALRCVYGDVRTKPPLSKPVKNFIPDTGLPSLKTLIEYKFVGSREAVGPIADEILADTCGYQSPEWNHFVYVVYETSRIVDEISWNSLLMSSGVSDNARVIVLPGEPREVTESGARRRSGRAAAVPGAPAVAVVPVTATSSAPTPGPPTDTI